jgi:hypothetical protein
VRTASGSTYLLLGPMTSGVGVNAQLSTDFVRSFADGFPEDWQARLTLTPTRTPALTPPPTLALTLSLTPTPTLALTPTLTLTLTLTPNP